MPNHRRNAVMVFAVLGILLVQFQNCAPAQEGVVGVSNDLKIVDRWNTSKVQFIAEAYYVNDDVDTVNIEGFCDGESVNWEVAKVSANGTVALDSGVSACEAGSFTVAMNSAQEHLQSCSDQVEISASLPDDSFEAKTSVRIQCF